MALRSTILTLLLASFVLSAFTYSDPEPEAGPHAQPRFLRPLQTVGVTVTLTCFGQPAPNVKVKLMNKDSWYAGGNDRLAEGLSNDQGRISLRGSKNQFSVISPYFNIYHECNEGGHSGQHKFHIEIPKSAVSINEIETKPNFDAGTIELSKPYQGEPRR